MNFLAFAHSWHRKDQFKQHIRTHSDYEKHKLLKKLVAGKLAINTVDSSTKNQIVEMFRHDVFDIIGNKLNNSYYKRWVNLDEEFEYVINKIKSHSKFIYEVSDVAFFLLLFV